MSSKCKSNLEVCHMYKASPKNPTRTHSGQGISICTRPLPRTQQGHTQAKASLYVQGLSQEPNKDTLRPRHLYMYKASPKNPTRTHSGQGISICTRPLPRNTNKANIFKKN